MEISKEEAEALVKVLSLAENHQMWTDPMRESECLKGFVDEQYAAITQVREFLKKHGIMTLHEFTQIAARKTFERMEKEDGGFTKGT